MDKTPEVPEFSMDVLLTQLIDRAQDVVAARSRLYKLIAANNVMVSNLDLQTLLQRIVELAADLVDAKYAAIGVIGPDDSLENFTHTGVSDEVAKSIGIYPEGRGLLGALLAEGEPLRLANMATDTRSVGFPPNHPEMTSFLGVPITVRGEVLGRLYLSDRADGNEFSSDDELFAVSLAATAGIAISNSRFLIKTQQNERWARAIAESMRAILNDEDALDILATAVCDISDADLVAILTRTGEDQIKIEYAVGAISQEIESLTFSLADSPTGQAALTRKTTILNDLANGPLNEFGDFGSTIVAPIIRSDDVTGLLVVARNNGEPAYSQTDADQITSFADQAGIAMERIKSFENLRHMELLEDRNRIARDLHDHVIQRLFAAGLSLKAVATKLGDTAESKRLNDQIVELDSTIAEIRQTIFALQRQPEDSEGLRFRVLEIVDRISPSLPQRPRVQFSGPIDLITDSALADDIVAVVNEGLTNIVKHANATEVSLTISAIAGTLSVEIHDDGVGLGDGMGHGLENMKQRAEKLGGEFEARRSRPKGTTITWTVQV